MSLGEVAVPEFLEEAVTAFSKACLGLEGSKKSKTHILVYSPAHPDKTKKSFSLDYSAVYYMPYAPFLLGSSTLIL